jgi:UDP-N-acetylmuramyl pentapeptide synthase
VGTYAAEKGLAALVVVDQRARAIADGARTANRCPVELTDDLTEAARLASSYAEDEGWILVKGSRAARLERVIEALERQAGRSA